MPKREAYLIPFSHLDLFWAGEELECLSRGSRIISRAIDLCTKDPGYRFLLEDAVFVEYFLRNHPQMRDQLRNLVQSGQIEIGPKWAGIHQSLQVGEELIRNVLYGTAFTRQELGYESQTIHLGDLPSWTPQFPQIADGLGLRNVISTRCGPRETPLFYWQAQDGTTVLTWYAVRGYHWGWSRKLHQPGGDHSAMQADLEELASLTPGPLLVHWGIDLVLPPADLKERVAEWNRVSSIPLTMATPGEFFAAAEKVPGLPVLQGDAPSLWPYLEAMYGRMVPLDIPAVAGLVQAETFCTMACLLGLQTYPTDTLASAWKRLLQGMDHNYPATGADDTRWRKHAYRTQAVQAGRWLAEDSLHRIAENVEAPAFPGVSRLEVVPIVVFNSLGWDREEVVTAHVTYHGDIHAMEVGRYRRIRLVDDEGASVPFQQVDIREGVCREDTLVFTASVPSMGYRTYYVIPEGTKPGTGFGPSLPDAGPTPHRLAPVLQREKDTYRSPFYRLQVDTTTGELTIHHTDGRMVLDKARLVALEEQPGNMAFRDRLTGRSFENVISMVQLVENGPVRARIKIQGRVLTSPVEQEVLVYADSPRIDIINRIDWRDVHPLRLLQLFPTGFTGHRVEYGVPFGSVQGEQLMPQCGPSNPDELPRHSWVKLRECIHWVDVTAEDATNGLFIATDRRSFDISSPTLACNLLRMCRHNYEIHIDEEHLTRAWRGELGRVTARFSLYPHQSDWRQHLLHRRGWEHNHPLWCVTSNDMESPKPLAPSFSLLGELGPGLVVTALKKAEEGDSFILRFFEATGSQGQARLQSGCLPTSCAEHAEPLLGAPELVDLQERCLQGGAIAGESLEVPAYGIKTVRLRPRPR